MNEWVKSFLQWFTTSPMGRSGLLLHSNIADAITIGDMSSLSMALFFGSDLPAPEMAVLQHLARNQSKTLINRLIGPAGNFPFDDNDDPDSLKSFGYHTRNCLDFMQLARLSGLATQGSAAGPPALDLFDWRSAQGASLHKSMLWLAPYCASNGSSWPYPGLHQPNPWLSRCRLIYRQAANQWQNASWEQISQHSGMAADGFLTFGWIWSRSPTFSSTLGVNQERQEPPRRRNTTDRVEVAVAPEQEEETSKDATFYFADDLVDGVVMRSNPQVPVITGVAPPGATVSVIQWCMRMPSGPDRSTRDRC